MKYENRTLMLVSIVHHLTLSWWRPLSYRNRSIDLLHKSMDWFLYDSGLRHERVKCIVLNYYHCVKSVCIRGYSGPYFPAFGLNTERFRISLRIQSKCGKIRSRITANTDTFHAVYIYLFIHWFRSRFLTKQW